MSIELFLFITLSICIVAPRNATGDKRVGGSPACGPEVAIKLLQLIKKLSNVKVFVPFTSTTDSGLWSICTSCFSLRLKITIKEIANANPIPREKQLPWFWTVWDSFPHSKPEMLLLPPHCNFKASV